MMTTKEQTSFSVQRRTFALSHCRLLRWWLLLFVLGWSCSVPKGSAEEIPRNLRHESYKNSKKMDFRYLQRTSKRGPARCPDKSPLTGTNSTSCLSEQTCIKSSYVVYWMKRQCLFQCPPGYINLKGYCSLTDVCPTVRISSVGKLNLLKNCRIVEGSVQIVRIKDVSENQWKHWRFPDLVEITEFLLVYQVEGLTNLGQLFPSLAVIRGMKLVHQYSLVIYDTRFEDIGLHSLRAILRGSVRVQNNINLCYVHTVNWDAIMQSSNDNVLTDNSESLCKNCCPSCATGQSQEQHCQYCWSSTKSQQICRHCRHGCTSDNKCCHEQCVGGCQTPRNDRACHACRNFNTGYRCVKNCGNLLEYKDYRCVSEQFCRRNNFIKFNGTQCVTKCPVGYKSSKNSTERMNICKKCEKGCDKQCDGGLVHTVDRAQELKDCTTIYGPLVIKYGKTVTKELEANLGKIQRVTHYVRIFKTSPLKSLNFLHSLKLIDGIQLHEKNALLVDQNANLEDIWDFSNHPKLNIIKGKISFYANPKLCYKNKIEKLLNLTGQEEDFGMQLTNGNKVACSIMKHAITLIPKPFKGHVVVRWTRVSTNEDDRKITGYFVYYKETNETNIGHMDGRDACNDEWKREHAEVKGSGSIMEVTLTHLKPDRRYAVYVETDTVADADIGARSNISYTTTMPHNPSHPLNLRVIEKGTTYIVVEWSPPGFPNGEIYDYLVSRTHLMHTEDTCQDFCKTEHIHLRKTEESDKDISESMVNRTSHVTATTVPPPKCCPCPEDPLPTVEEDELEFEPILHSHIYIHRTNRNKRAIESDDDASSNSNHSFNNPSWMAHEAKYTEYQRGRHTTEDGTSRSKTNKFNLTGLSHYAQYQIEVSACHKPQGNCPNDMDMCQLCSTTPARIVETTAKKDNANAVVNLKIEHIRQSSVKVTWAPPISPNGQVLAYMVFIFNAMEDTKFSMYCVPSCEYNKSQDKYNLDLANLTPATKYRTKVQAYTRAPMDMNDIVPMITFTTEDEDAEDHGQMLLILTIFLLLVVMCGILVFRRVRPLKLPVKQDDKEPCYPHDPSPLTSVIPSQYQIDPESLRLEGNILDWGNSGVVFKGHLQRGSERVPVAVKQAINLLSPEDMLLEAKLMLGLKSCHIVHAFGVMFGENHTYLVMEYMSKGNLIKYLRQLKEMLDTVQVCDMALQIADGMAYLASKNYVHRDLAARNCLINDDMKIKISDFGMTRIAQENGYQIDPSESFPVRWLAPECFTKQRFTTESDVWSYGIVLWEILTCGKKPYQDLITNDEVRDKVSNGHTLKGSVQNLTDKWLADLTCSCWESENDRPSFRQIISTLLPWASPHFKQLFSLVSFYHQSIGQEEKKVDLIRNM